MNDDLHYISATEALARFRDRSLSPVELLDAVIARAEAVEPTVNALCHERYDAAREEARAAEARYAGRGDGEPRALEGIPLAIKEEEAVAGQPWTQGSLIYKDLVAERSSAFAQRMLDAGAIVHARTTAPEFSCALFTHSRLHGVTRNPWNPEFGVGGSSGGAGAALAAGTTTLASGSDIGGSIRAPASFNGVVGFKPPYGRVPQAPPFNLDTYCHCGPLARTVADTALYENVLAGPDPTDIVSLRPKYELPETFEGIAGMRLAVSVDMDGSWPVDPEIRRNTLDAAAALREAGARVEEAAPPGGGHELTLEIWRSYGDDMDAAALYGLLRRWDAYRGDWAAFDRRYDLVLSPVFPGPARPHGGMHVPGEIEPTSYTTPHSLTGRPAATVRCGTSPEGLPIAVQVAAAPWRDDVALAAALRLEQELGGWRAPEA